MILVSKIPNDGILFRRQEVDDLDDQPIKPKRTFQHGPDGLKQQQDVERNKASPIHEILPKEVSVTPREQSNK